MNPKSSAKQIWENLKKDPGLKTKLEKIERLPAEQGEAEFQKLRSQDRYRYLPQKVFSDFSLSKIGIDNEIKPSPAQKIEEQVLQTRGEIKTEAVSDIGTVKGEKVVKTKDEAYSIRDLKDEQPTPPQENVKPEALKSEPEKPRDEIFERALENIQRQQKYNVVLPRKQSRPEIPVVIKRPPPIPHDVFRKALENTAVEKVSQNRTNQDYRDSEKAAFDLWCIKTEHSQESPEATAYKQSEEYKEKSDGLFKEIHQGEVKREIEAEKIRIYKNIIDDPILRELKKLVAENQENESIQVSEKTPELPPAPIEKEKNPVIVFIKEFPRKALAYATAVPIIRDELLKKQEIQKTVLRSPLSTIRRSLSRIFVAEPMEEIRQSGVSGEQTYQTPQRQTFMQSPVSRTINGVNRIFGGRGAGEGRKIGQNALNKGRQKAERKIFSFATKRLATSFFSSYLWLIILIIILLLILLMQLQNINQQQFNQLQTGQVSIQKTVSPTEVPNRDDNNPDASDATFTITVSYSGLADQIIVTDPIPDNAEFVSASSGYIIEPDAATGKSVVKWSFVPNGSTGISSTSASTTVSVSSPYSFDQAKFQGYGFPAPQSPNPVSMQGEIYKKWQTVMPYAIQASQKTGVDVGIIGWWAWSESNGFDYCFENCVNGTNTVNAGCYCSINAGDECLWQVGTFANHPQYTKSSLSKAIEEMHPGQTVQQIGQAVIDQSKNRCLNGRSITNPSSFGNYSLQQILDGAGNGDMNMKLLLATLYKDDGIGAYLAAVHLNGYVGPNFAKTMRGWGSYYDPQKIINHIKAIYDAGITGGTGTTQSTQAFTLTLRPKSGVANDYIINQASAEVIGGSLPTGGNICSATDLGQAKENICHNNVDYQGQTYTSYQLPVSSYYTLNPNGGSPREDQWGRSDLVQVISSVAQKWASVHPDLKIGVGDMDVANWTLARGSHGCGVDADIYASTVLQHLPNDSNNPNYNPQLAIELGKLFMDTNAMKYIFYDDPTVQNAVNPYIQSKGLSGKLYTPSDANYGDHLNHFHIRVIPGTFKCESNTTNLPAKPASKSDWMAIFKQASQISQVPWEFLASITIQETGLGADFGICSYYPPPPGGHVLTQGNGLRKTANDAQNFSSISQKLSISLNTGVSCNPPGSCCGGAMGYTQIMPDELIGSGLNGQTLLSHYPNPWDALDSVVFTGILLKAKVKIGFNSPMPEDYNTMYQAAWRYYGYTPSGQFYPNQVMARYLEIKKTQSF